MQHRFDELHSTLVINVEWKNSPRSLKLFPDTRVAHTHLLLQRLIESRKTFRELLYPDDWNVLTSSMKSEAFYYFQDNAYGNSLWKKFQSVTSRFVPISNPNHHIEQNKSQVIWIYLLARAVFSDCDTWGRTDTYFRAETRSAVLNWIPGGCASCGLRGSTVT